MINKFLIAPLKSGLTETFWFLVKTGDRYRAGVRAFARKTGLERTLLANSLVRRLLLTKDEPRYQSIFTSAPTPANPGGDFELHLLICERDLLRGMWALKSFYRYAGLDPKLVIHNDGSLSDHSIRTLQSHFPGCDLVDGKQVEEAMGEYPVIRYYRKKHVLARKIIDVLLAARSGYVMVMDTDVLWFGESDRIKECVKESRPFYVPGIRDALARNTPFLNKHCDLFPAPNVNSGMIGFRLDDFLDFAFIESALDKMIHIPPELVTESIGFPVPETVKQGNFDPVDSVSWWVMEQTLYALLFGRCTDVLQLNVKDDSAGKTHQFVNTAITDNTALVHFLFDSHWNAQFPVGVEHLLKSW